MLPKGIIHNLMGSILTLLTRTPFARPAIIHLTPRLTLTFMRLTPRSLLFVFICLLTSTAFGQGQPHWPCQPIVLPFVHPLFSDHMVLQRDIAAPIWGWSIPGDRISIAIDGHPAAADVIVSEDGTWKTKISSISAGG